MPDLDWRAWLDKLGRLWRSSLQVRTVAITVLLSAVAVFVIGGGEYVGPTAQAESPRLDMTASASAARRTRSNRGRAFEEDAEIGIRGSLIAAKDWEQDSSVSRPAQRHRSRRAQCPVRAMLRE